MAKKPELDEPTRQLAERLLKMPPKSHDEMKVGKTKANRPKSPGDKRRKSQAKKPGK